MNKTQLAQILDGVEYAQGIPDAIVEQARANGLVIVYGYSDDAIEFDGAIHDEAYVSGGDVVKFDREGVIPEWDTVEKENEQEVRDYFKRVDGQVSEIFVAEDYYGFYWAYDTMIPHETFRMLEDGEPYCQGIVFHIDDMEGF